MIEDPSGGPGELAPEPAVDVVVEPAAVFWDYSDLLLFASLSIPAMLLGFGVVKLLLIIIRYHPVRVAELLAEQFAGYVLLSLVLVLIFRYQYGRPFWKSLAWVPSRIPAFPLVLLGVLTALATAGVGWLLKTPNTANPMTDLLRDRTSMILMAIFGVTLGPLAEELVFRGFLQPLLVRTLGAVGGILATALPFGLLHFQEYGNSWRHVVLIGLSGVAFGWIRQASGSTRSATLMHAAYNAVFFAALIQEQMK